jgi:hypothetical protein
MVVPFVIKGLFSPDGGLDKKFKLVMTGFANIPVGYVEVVSAADGLLDSFPAYITGYGLHILLLSVFLLWRRLRQWDETNHHELF